MIDGKLCLNTKILIFLGLGTPICLLKSRPTFESISLFYLSLDEDDSATENPLSTIIKQEWRPPKESSIKFVYKNPLIAARITCNYQGDNNTATRFQLFEVTVN